MGALSSDLVTRWRDGDQHAAEILCQRYSVRLLALARRRLSAPLARHIDAEDVVQSAYLSFFAGARAGRFTLKGGGDLWRLLAAITVHKVQRLIERQTAGKRDLARECHFGGESSLEALSPRRGGRELSPSDAAALADTLEQACRGLEPLQRRIVELRLAGHGLDAIAAEVRRSERTVRRVLEQVKERLRLSGLGSSGL